MVSRNEKKRRSRTSRIHEPERVRRNEIPHDWEKDEEELELEATLFGKSRKKYKPVNGERNIMEASQNGNHDFEFMQDDEVN